MRSDAVRYILPKGLHMQPQRELRYYANVPKVLVLLIGSAGGTFAGWRMLTSGANVVGSWLVLGFFGLCMLIGLRWLGVIVVLRKPILRINEAGFTEHASAAPWRSFSVSWVDVTGICIRVLRSRSGFLTRSTYFFVVQARHADQLPGRTTKVARWTTAMFPSLKNVAMAESLNMMFLWPTRRMRANMLERIKTTFTPEISRYHIRVDEEERPL